MFLRFLTITFLLFTSLIAREQEQHLSVTEESLPRLPSPPAQKEDQPILIEQLKAIVLVGNPDAILKNTALDKIEGVQFVDINLPGNPKRLKRKLLSFIGNEVTSNTLVEIKEVISDYYQDSRHSLVLIEIPEQDITSSALQLIVLESRLGMVKVEGNRWVSSQKLKKYIKLRPNQCIDEGRLFRNVDFINRNPFRRVDIIYSPGEETGTTDVILSTKDRRPLRLYTGAENTGVKPVGRGRWYTGFNWGNAFGLDHILSYQFTGSYNLHRFRAHTAQYIAFLSWGHVFNVYGGYSEVHPKVHRPVRRNHGWSTQLSGRYTVPLNIYRYLVHEVVAGYDFKRTNNTFEFVEGFPRFGKNVNLTQFALSYSGNYERNTFRLDFNGSIYYSPGRWLSDQTNADYDSLRPGAVNHWFYFRGSFVYLQRLPRSFSLSLLARGQGSSQPLLPSEQFGLGGYDTVRGYEQGELYKDQAILLSGEARSPALPLLKYLNRKWKIPDALQFLIFIDYGWGINIDTIPEEQKADYLLGIGPGIRYTIEPYLTTRLDWGIKLHKKASFGGGNTMVYFNITAGF